MNTALLFGTATVVTVTGAASLPFLMHRLEDSLQRPLRADYPAEAPTTAAASVGDDLPAVPGMPQPDAA